MSPISISPQQPNRMAGFTPEELRQMSNRIPVLQTEARAELRRRAQVADPGWIYFRFSVQFDGSGVKYQFAAIRVPGGAIYTTGTGYGSVFPDWEALIQWLQQPDKHWVSNITELSHMDGHRGVSPFG